MTEQLTYSELSQIYNVKAFMNTCSLYMCLIYVAVELSPPDYKMLKDWYSRHQSLIAAVTNMHILTIDLLEVVYGAEPDFIPRLKKTLYNRINIAHDALLNLQRLELQERYKSCPIPLIP